MRMVDRVATASRVPAILADAGGASGRHGARTGCARTSVCSRWGRRDRLRAAPHAFAMKNGRPEGRPSDAAKRSRIRYSAMSADAFAGRAGAPPVACDGAVRSIFGGGDNCSTSLV